MKYTKTIRILFSIIFALLFTTMSCQTVSELLGSFSQDSTEQESGGDSQTGTEQKSDGNVPLTATRKTNEPFYTGDGGKGIVIAVPAPAMENGTAADNWMPQLFQDLITGDFARYSAMTVLDRANEQMILAEQQMSMSGNYSEEDYIRIGHLTNAAFIVAGKIINVSGRYSVSFRITNTETNEIKASFNKAYPLTDIETGFAAKETAMELLDGLGVELTEAGRNSLLAIPEIEVRSTAQLAKGMAAEKDGNEVEALAFFVQALESNPNMGEADNRIQNFAAVSVGGSIRERANYAQTQIDKWKKIFADLETYLDNNLLIGVYDFSVIEDKINMSSKRVTISVKPGVKLVPNRTTLLVYKKVMDEWKAVKNREENKLWVREASPPSFGDYPFANSGDIGYYISMETGLYDDYGDRITTGTRGRSSYVMSVSFSQSAQPTAQRKYYDDEDWEYIVFGVPLDDITDTLTPKVDKLFFSLSGNREVSIPIMSVAEWEQWLMEQGL